MRTVLGHLLVALAITLAVGLLSGGGWSFLVGAVLSLSLWVMLFAGSYAVPGRGTGRTTVRDYALAAVVSVVLGYVIFRVGEDNASFWAVGFILGGIVVPVGTAAASSAQQDAEAGDGAR